jgi:hypothetical protein
MKHHSNTPCSFGCWFDGYRIQSTELVVPLFWSLRFAFCHEDQDLSFYVTFSYVRKLRGSVSDFLPCCACDRWKWLVCRNFLFFRSCCLCLTLHPTDLCTGVGCPREEYSIHISCSTVHCTLYLGAEATSYILHLLTEVHSPHVPG